MARIKGVDIPNDKHICISLTYIYGIGRSLAKQILKEVDIDPTTKTSDLSQEDFDKREKFNVLDVPKGFEAMKSVKDYFGEKSLFYIGMIQGVGKIMNFDFEETLEKNLRILLMCLH